ncbi:zinc finger protein OZF-like isoform X2 [Thalassophryne amazonica]|uniref:zinc finger protein OZF-like isoform X2 n=1 Tax=Thalassophryne amazonica TaxID=390379 RepID=UPI0014716059|nr:zinc finger protein OZF-like isoform X2 [Thalassophryne amazonica]
MSKVQMLRALVKQRLTAAAEEIFGLFERTIAEYEEELCRSKEENHRQRHLLDTVFNPDVHLQAADVQQLLVKEEDPLEQQDCSSSVGQDDPDSPHIKEEKEEAGVLKFRMTHVTVKIEDDEDKPQSSQLHQRQSEEKREAELPGNDSAEHIIEFDGEDCESEPDTNSDPDSYLQPYSDKDNITSEPGIEVSDKWKETRETNKAPLSEMKLNPGEKPFGCSECDKRFGYKSHLNRHMRIHRGEKPFSCAHCPKRFLVRSDLQRHTRVHTGEKPFICSICGKRFIDSSSLGQHIRCHNGEKPFSCSVCNKCFGRRSNLLVHTQSHSKEKVFSCSVCGKTFTQYSNLSIHKRIHSGVKPFTCSVCNRCFTQKTNLVNHMSVHTGEKRFRCRICGKGFSRHENLKKHQCVGVVVMEDGKLSSL